MDNRLSGEQLVRVLSVLHERTLPEGDGVLHQIRAHFPDVRQTCFWTSPAEDVEGGSTVLSVGVEFPTSRGFAPSDYGEPLRWQIKTDGCRIEIVGPREESVCVGAQDEQGLDALHSSIAEYGARYWLNTENAAYLVWNAKPWIDNRQLGPDLASVFDSLLTSAMNCLAPEDIEACKWPVNMGSHPSEMFAIMLRDSAHHLSSDQSVSWQLLKFLRNVIPNPFAPVAIEAAWLTPAVIDFCRSVKSSGDFSSTPDLANMLEGVGCGSTPLLDHLRDSDCALYPTLPWGVRLILEQS